MENFAEIVVILIPFLEQDMVFSKLVSVTTTIIVTLAQVIVGSSGDNV